MKKIAIAVIATISVSLMAFANALAWGPERETFTMENPASYATFNSITNNPTLGDERNFVRIREAGVGNYVDEIKLEIGKEYEIYSYYDNNSKPSISMTEEGSASNVRMRSSFPAIIKSGERASAQTTISADDTTPKEVWDDAFMTTDKDVKLTFVDGSGVIHNGGRLNGQGVPADYLFDDNGVLLGYNNFSGVIPGENPDGTTYDGYVTYKVRVEAVDITASETNWIPYVVIGLVAGTVVVAYLIIAKNKGVKNVDRK